MSKKTFFIVACVFVLGIVFAVHKNSAEWFQANVITSLTCSRLEDTSLLQCNDKILTQQQCPRLTYVDGTSYIFQLPKTMLNYTCAGTETFWTKTLTLADNTTTIQTSSQNIVTASATLPAIGCGVTSASVCLDAARLTEINGIIVASWTNEGKNYYVVNIRDTDEYYEYVFDVSKNQWLYSTLKDTAFAGSTQTFTLEFPAGFITE